MMQVVENESGTPVQTEAVTEAIRDHETETHDWGFREPAVRLNKLFDDLNGRFFHGRLPKAVISIGPDLIVRYGYYVIGRDEIGAKHRVHLNARHFGRTEMMTGVTLAHEMVHLFQHLYGTIGKRPRYHNKEFVELAADVGIVAAIGNGITVAVSDGLRGALAEFGFSREKPMMAGVDDSPIRRPLRKVMWECGCGQEIWVDRGVSVYAQCTICDQAFWLHAAGEEDIHNPREAADSEAVARSEA